MSDGSPTVDVDADGPAVDLGTHQFDALLRTLDETGEIGYEELRIASREDGFVFESGPIRRVGLDESELREVATNHARTVTNWYFWEVTVGATPHRRAFLRWIERADDRSVDERYTELADGVAREWGQLHISARLDGDGGRRYEIRHADEAGAPDDQLEAHDDPLDARRLVKFDDGGRYRPLKTAPSLPTGWTFSDLDARDCYETIEIIYPATIANWYREERGDLDVDHWRDAAERQTGIYDVVDELDAEAVDDIAAACCDDSQCLKRREWEYDGDHELSADTGDGPFPCREPCSVVVAASRKWTLLEREASREYIVELTPSEKEQLEELVDAVADGRVQEIREADVDEGANRYRARYLREKLFDERGNLGGVPTDRDDETGCDSH